MKVIKADSITRTTEFGISCGRLAAHIGFGQASPPMGFMYCFVPAGDSSTLHRHEDSEFFFIIRGRGVVTNGSVGIDCGPLDLVMLEGGESHTIRNVSETDELAFLSAYWIHGAAPQEDASQ